MKREFLLNFKVGDQPLPKDVIDAIMEENGQDIEAAKKPYEDYDHIKNQLEEAQKTIKGFQDQDIDGIRKSAKDWEEKYNQAVSDHKQQLASMAFDRTLEGAITAAKGKNAKLPQTTSTTWPFTLCNILQNVHNPFKNGGFVFYLDVL